MNLKRTVDITYKISGLEKLQSLAKETRLFATDDSELNKVETEIKSLMDLVGKAENGFVSVEAAEQFAKEYEKIQNRMKKIRTDLIAIENKEAADMIADIEKKVSELDDKIQKSQEDYKKFESSIKKDPSGNFVRAEGSLGKDVLQGAAQKLKPDEQMVNPITGRDLKNATTFLEGMKKVDVVVNSIRRTHSDIYEKLKEGKTLTKSQQEDFDSILIQHGDISLNAEQINKQIKNRKKLLSEEQKAYQKIYTEESKRHSSKIKNLQDERKLLEDERETNEMMIQDDSMHSKEIAERLGHVTKMLETLTEVGGRHKEEVSRRKREQAEYNKTLKEGNKEKKKQETTMGRATKQVFSYGLAFTFLRRVYRETIRTIRDLDSALTEMAIVTSMSRIEAWNLVGTMQQLAKETGFTTTEVAKLSTIYFRQGRTLTEVIELTRVAGQAARVAGISAAESANYLTSAVNGFALAAEEALSVSDKFAALAASSASSYEELAVGLSKFGAQAYVAGIGMDFALGMLAKGVETTREAPETIGTALKTVIARLRELTDLGKTFEDGMDINRVETALKQVGVQLRDSSGQFRDMEQVLTDVGMRWADLNTNQQASIAVALAGTRQQSRLIAIMNNFERTLELTTIAQESAGATTAQHMEYMKGMEAAMVGLQTSWQALITTITDSEVIIGIVRGLSGALQGISNAFNSMGIAGKNAMAVIIGLTVGIRSYTLAKKIAQTQLGAYIGLNKIFAGTLAKTGVMYDLQTKKQLRSIGLKPIEIMQILASKKAHNAETFAKIQNALASDILDNAEKRSQITRALQIKQTASSIFLQKLFKIEKIRATIATKAATIAKKKEIVATGILGKTTLFLDLSIRKAWLSVLKFNAALLASPLAPFIILMSTVVGLFFAYQKGAEDAAKGTESIFSNLYRGLQAFVNILKTTWDAIKNLINILKPLIVIALVPILIPLAKIVLWITLVTAGIRFFNAVLNRLIGWLRDTIEALKEKFAWLKWIGEQLEKFKGFIGSVVDTGKDLLKILTTWEEAAKIAAMSFDQLADSLHNLRQANEADNYELRQKNRAINDLIAEYERLDALQRSGIMSSEERDAFESLGDEFKNLEEGRFVVFGAGGVINREETIKAMKKSREENAHLIARNILETAKYAANLAEKNWDAFVRGEGGGLSSILDFLMFRPDSDLTEEQSLALRNHYESLIKGMEETSIDVEELYDRNFDNLLNIVKDFNKNINKELENPQDSAFLRNMNLYKEALEELVDEDLQKSFSSTFQHYQVILENFGDSIEEYAEMFDFMGFNVETYNRLALAAAEAGTDITSVLTAVQSAVKSLDESVPEEMRMTVAFSQIALAIDDATLSMELFNLAAQSNILEVTQAVDHLRSKINRLNEDRDKFFTGELSDVDFYDLVQDYAEFFAQDKFMEDFINGRNLSIYLLKEEMKAQKDYQEQLIATRYMIRDLEKSESDEDKQRLESLKTIEAKLILLTNYRGELHGLTINQYKYNNLLKAHNNLSGMNIENLTLQEKLVTKLRSLTGETLANIDDQISSIFEQLSESGIPEGMLSIRDGVVYIEDAFNDLSDTAQQQFVEGLAMQLDSQLDKLTEFYTNLMNESIGFEQKIADEKIKVYEDYFASLDRLNQRRERAESREDLVKQLERLEGATDERSRKRALELRQQLNNLDQKTAEETLAESRQSLIQSISDGVESIRSTFADAWLDFIASADTAGGDLGESLFNIMKSYGLVDENGEFDLGEVLVRADDSFELPELNLDDLNLSEHIKSITDAIEAASAEKPEEENRLFTRLDTIIGLLGGEEESTPEDRGRSRIHLPRHVQSKTIHPVAGEGSSSVDLTNTDELSKFMPGHAKGGMIDYTGVAMLHGSRSRPEAVLSPSQTELFVQLRDALTNTSSKNINNSSSVNIENITIKTDNLNNKQDFNQAGQELAKSFANAMSKRGIQLNTKI